MTGMKYGCHVWIYLESGLGSQRSFTEPTNGSASSDYAFLPRKINARFALRCTVVFNSTPFWFHSKGKVVMSSCSCTNKKTCNIHLTAYTWQPWQYRLNKNGTKKTESSDEWVCWGHWPLDCKPNRHSAFKHLKANIIYKIIRVI